MAQPTISDLSTTPGSNADFNAVGIIGSSLLSTADDAFRMLASMLAGYTKDLAGLGAVTGSANAIALTVNQPFAALATGLVIAFKNTVGPNTGAVALAVTNSLSASLGTNAIRLQGDIALGGGEMLANGIYVLRYDAAYNSAAGAWVLLNSSLPPNPLVLTGSAVGFTPFRGVSTEAAAAAGPLLDLYRNSASPAASDFIAEVDFTGQNSTPAKVTYGSIGAQITDPTASSEDAGLIVKAMLAGALTAYLNVGLNANRVDLPLGQLGFPATQNSSSNANTNDDYEEGSHTSGLAFGGGTTGITYSEQPGAYTKNGRGVTVVGDFVLTSKGSSTGSAAITGLPFGIQGNQTPFLPKVAGMSSLTGAVKGNGAGGGGTTISLFQSGSAGDSTISNTSFSGTDSVIYTGAYMTST